MIRVLPPEPFWLGASANPVLAVLHRPDGPATGAVVVCNPFGYQSTCANRTLRTLAEGLSTAGLAVLRLDYVGTGNSGEVPEGSDDLAAWRDSLQQALGHLHSLGFPTPTVVGFRLGAALAAAGGGHGPLVLWAPPESGRAVSRELRAQAASTPGGGRDGLLNVVGNPLRSVTVRALRSWDPYAGLGEGDVVLVVADPVDPQADAVEGRARAQGASVESLRRPGTEQVLGRTAETAQVPARLVGEIRQWVVANSARRGGVDLPPVDTDPVRLIDYDDHRIREELVRIGHQGLTAVLAGPEGPAIGPVVCFLNNGVAGSAGPAGLWTHYARELAVRGIPSLRVDVRGLGTSPDPTIRPIHQDVPVRPEIGADVDATVADLRARGFGRVVLTGLCSGGYTSIMNAALAPEPADAVVSINPPLFNLRDVGWTQPRPRVWGWVSWAMCKDPLRRLAGSGPRAVWTAADRTNVFPAPDRFLARAAARVDVTLVLSEGGSEMTDFQTRSTGGGLTNPGVRLDIVPEMEHSLFDWTHRERVLEHLADAARGSGLASVPDSTQESA